MDFEFDEDQKLFRDSLREFLQKEIAPIADDMDRKGALTREEALGIMRKLRKVGIGYDMECITELFGDMIMYGIVAEELSRVWASLLPLFGMTALPGILVNFATDDVKDKWIPRMERGEFIGCFGESEPAHGCDTSGIETTAVQKGDKYVINGNKTWISNATIEDMTLVGAKIDGEATFILVDKEESPYGSSLLHKIGWNADPTGELFFEDCEAPVENEMNNLFGNAMSSGVLEEFGKKLEGFMGMFAQMAPATALLTPARAGMALGAVGIAEAALEASKKYVKERVQFGKQIGKFQLIQEMLYEIQVFVDTARLLGYNAIYAVQRGLPEARRLSAEAKVYACHGCVKATYLAVQIHGGMGLSTEMPLERYFRDARMMTVPDGTNEIMKLVTGYEMLGKGFSAYI
ncbi:MAG TPA: acyl-CoA/acyl-ACP dehydrogenase [Halobacteria archaeon]|nr:acyl-CoA/acyl-ACP dehydrogenase [Halobacteria archaeon]